MDYARIRAVADELSQYAPDVLRGYEIASDGITMMVPPSRSHEFNTYVVREQLAQQLPPELVAHTGGEVEDPSRGRLRRPDAIVVPRTVFAEQTMAPFTPEDVELVVEVVGPSNYTNDYVDKLAEYAAMGIAHYLLVDPRKGTVAVFEVPGPGAEGQRYRRRHDYVFGEDVVVGPWTLSTSELHMYPAGG